MPRRRRKQRAEIWLGLLVIVAAVLLTWGYFWLTGQPLGERGYDVIVLLPDAEGLKRGDRVQLAGVEVGSVRNLRLVTPEQVAVTLFIQRGVRLPRDSRALLQSVGVFGDQVIALQPGTSTTPAAEGDTLATGVSTGLIELAGELGDEARTLLSQLERLLADTTIDQLHGGVAALPGTMRGLERLIRDNGDEFAAMSRSLRQTAETLNQAMSGADVDQAVADLRATASTLAETADVLLETAESLASVTDKIDRGEGTLGLLVNDPGLYEDLRSTTRSLGSLSQDIQQNPGRYLKLAIF